MAILFCTFDLLLQMRGCLFVCVGEVVGVDFGGVLVGWTHQEEGVGVGRKRKGTILIFHAEAALDLCAEALTFCHG